MPPNLTHLEISDYERGRAFGFAHCLPLKTPYVTDLKVGGCSLLYSNALPFCWACQTYGWLCPCLAPDGGGGVAGLLGSCLLSD